MSEPTREPLAGKTAQEWKSRDSEGPVAQIAAMTGTDVATYTRDRPGMSAFVLEDGVVYHTYSAYSRGVDAIWSMYPVARPRPQGAQRDRLLVAPPRRVRQ